MATSYRSRDLIRAILKYSNLSLPGTRTAYEHTGVFAGADAWKRAARIGLLTLGTGFLVAGIFFFFAWNWQDLHRFAKLGILQALILATMAPVLYGRLDQTLKNVLLTGASLLVGGLFAVYGQIYQTGANAYDFFLGWSAAIALWSFAAVFPPLWLLLLLLVNTTVVMYAEQVAGDWDPAMLYLLLFGINAGTLLGTELLIRTGVIRERPLWFLKTVLLAATGCITAAFIGALFDESGGTGALVAFLALPFFAWGVYESFRQRVLFYLAIIAMAGIVIISALLIKMAADELIGMLFLVGLFILVSTTLLIRQLLHLNKLWHGTIPTDPPAAQP